MTYASPAAAPLMMPHFTTSSTYVPRQMTGERMQTNGVPDGNGLPWPAANRALYIPIRIPQPITVVKMYRYIGGIAGGNWDVGIYDAAFTRLVSSGSTAAGSTSTTQVFDITDTFLAPGTYYIAAACDSSSGRTIADPSSADLNIFKLWGVMEQATAFALPSTATPVVCTSDYYPIIGCSTTTIVT